ncbi:hypothetical protein E2C01_086967 [Portunus trituberculatus]|uniref:Uncharacterized protein n=1 Tax=Portunus trituberculatus TaxID=210409 RepID=A0A5B7JHT8_PORTR|nr:hypothetical protein [Portunus trituberculatus]
MSSSVTSTRSSLSIFPMPLTILYLVIRSPRSFPSFVLHMLGPLVLAQSL